jgi:predicted Zn finger-like uncharacterized protein
MKVVCESCQAKYQVPDERVAGKKLKIRCKRCGATVLIRGDLTQIGLDAGTQPAADHADLAPAVPAAELEWHASIDGQSFGPFDTSTLLRWLDEQPGGWDAHVWRDGVSDWVEVRACPELMAAAPAAAPWSDAASAAEADATGYGDDEEEGPTRTFSSEDIGVRRSKTLSGTQAPDDFRTRGSSIRTRPSPAPAYAAAPAMGGTWSGGAPAAAASPRVTAAQAMTGERHEDSVLFSTSNLQQVAMTTSQPGYGTANPGFASGEASGLIDIRALASLARQTTPAVAPGAAYDRFRADDDSKIAVMNQTGAFNTVDSLAPVSTASTSSSAAVPLAILGGFALVAAAAFAAILITRDAKETEAAAAVAVMPEEPSTATGAQPTVTPEPATTPTPDLAAAPAAAEPPPEAKEPEPAAAAPAADDDEGDELASAKAKRKSSSSRTTAESGDDEKKTVPADKAKPKKEEKSTPTSLDEVMLAEKPSKPEKVEPEPRPEPAAPKVASGNSDIDDLLGGTPAPKNAAKAPSKSRSIDDLLDVAVDEKKAKAAAPAPAPAAAAAATSAPGADEADDLPATPSRDETLAAMRGVESAVRACNTTNAKGTAEVSITVTGSTGRVTNATVTGLTGEVGSCIARAARNAKFGKFSKPNFQIKYPYRFQ